MALSVLLSFVWWTSGFFQCVADTNVPAWKLVWSEEFDQPDGSKPNSSRWAYDTGGGGWGNNELESYTSRTNNARIESGMLVIEARRESYTGADGINRSFTSARLKTEGKFTAKYGRIEARMKIPSGQGLWPAFWLLGANISTVSWPTCGEVDIMENIGKEPALVHATVHGPGYSGGSGIGHPYALPNGANFADAFHLYSMEWSTNQMRFLVDNIAYFTVTSASLPPGKNWVFNAPQFILLNLAVGGSWPGNPDASTVFPKRLTVDYVRVYSATNAPIPAVGIERITNHVFLSWPLVFPNAAVESSPIPLGPWKRPSLDGQRTSVEFLAEVGIGFYRLNLGN